MIEPLVPGGTVKELTRSSDGSKQGQFELDLVASGSDAASELGTKLKYSTVEWTR